MTKDSKRDDDKVVIFPPGEKDDNRSSEKLRVPVMDRHSGIASGDPEAMLLRVLVQPEISAEDLRPFLFSDSAEADVVSYAESRYHQENGSIGPAIDKILPVREQRLSALQSKLREYEKEMMKLPLEVYADEVDEEAIRRVETNGGEEVSS